MVKRLLVPLDQSRLSEGVLPLARGLARQLDLPVTLLSIVDAPTALLRGQGAQREASSTGRGHDAPADPFMPSAGQVTESSVSPAALEKLAEDVTAAERYLQTIAETFDAVTVETGVLYGDPAERILDFAETRPDPVVVMASHGRTGLARMLLGSVTARVVQTARCPVFVVRGSEASTGMGAVAIERVLIPLDGSRFSEQALVTVQQTFGSRRLYLILFRALETQRARGAYEHPASDEYVQSVRKEAESYLEEKASQLRAGGHTVTSDFGEGRVAERINASAHAFKVDLIAMATHGSNTDFRRFVLGSVAEQVLHEADRPLLLVRPTE